MFLPTAYVESLIPSTPDCGIFRDRAFKEVIISLGPDQIRLVSLKKEIWTHEETPGDVCAQKKDWVKIQQEAGLLQAKERDLGQNQTLSYLGLRHFASSTERKSPIV